jgi:hypothetical protein
MTEVMMGILIERISCTNRLPTPRSTS